MELMEELYTDDNKRAYCKSMQEYIDNSNQSNEPVFTRILCDFHICLGCGYTQWREHCSTCVPNELTILEIMHRSQVWQNVGREIFIS